MEAAGGADYFIVIVPYTPQNHHFVSREVIDALPTSAVFINIARGAVIDQAALVDELVSKRLAGAGLDVFEREPLPPDHVLWTLSNVIITPHVGGISSNLVDQLAPVIADNLARWFSTPRRPLGNPVAAGAL